tara:strand:+ start:982 stop:1191 length:210 start_codon:yes stop_codon:yes gene_type:complete
MKPRKYKTKPNNKVHLFAILSEVEELINSGIFNNMAWDEPEMMEDLGCNFDKDDMLGGLKQLRDFINDN